MDAIYKRLNDETELEDDDVGPSEIQEFFTGQTVFLSGCTGFVGKVLVEKLLRSCSDLKKIYFLVRPKKEPCAKRMEKYFEDVLFDRLKEEVPNYHAKVGFVQGDLMKENLGLSTEDRAKLIEEATLIYHNGSNVKFDEKISVAIRVNVFGTQYMLDLAKECKRLLAFIYVSTAYSHSYMQHIDDKFYPPPVQMSVVNDILAVDEMNDRGIEEKALQAFRSHWSNNYVFTKSLAESLVEQCGKQSSFACAVYRPSIIISTYEEPMRGWCCNLNGPVGSIVGCGVGFIHALPQCIYPMDMTPVDMCVNALIVATWDVVEIRKFENEPVVYNFGSSVENPLSVQQLINKLVVRGQDMGTMNMMGGFYVIYTKCDYHWWFLHIVTHLFPALLADLILLLRGKKPMVLTLWIRLTQNAHFLRPYVDGNWRIHVPNMRKIWGRLNKRDAKLFYSDIRSLDWDVYAHTYWAGIRTFMLKDPMETAEKGGRQFKRLIFIQRVIYYLGQAIILFFLAQWLLPIFY